MNRSLEIATKVIKYSLLVAPMALPLVIKDEEDREQAERYLALFTAAASKLSEKLIEIAAAVDDPSTIDYMQLFNETVDDAVARARAIRE